MSGMQGGGGGWGGHCAEVVLREARECGSSQSCCWLGTGQVMQAGNGWQGICKQH